MIAMLLTMTAASFGLAALGGLIFWLIMPIDLAIASTIGAFIGLMICTWVIAPITERP